MRDLGALLTVTAVLACIAGGLAYVGPQLKLSAETSRKAGHVLMGLLCLSFPWLFEQAWPVLLLCLVSLLIFSWVRTHSGPLRGVFHGVARKSHGELLFPVSVTIMFLVQENPITDYVVPILILTVADAAGALVGVNFGNSKYSTDEGSKSWEGSLAFFAMAFLCTFVPLLLFTPADLLAVSLIAVLVGLIIMLVEAVSWRGLDNLFIPLGTYLLLSIYLQLSPDALLTRLLALAGIAIVLWLIRGRTYCRDGTMLASALYLYTVWVVGGVTWTLPPFALLVGYILLCPSSLREQQLGHSLADLGVVVGVGSFWLFASVDSPKEDFFWPFALSWIAQLAIISCVYFAWRQKETRLPGAIAKAGAICLGLFILPLTAAAGLHDTFKMLPVVVVTIIATVSIYWKIENDHFKNVKTPAKDWRKLAYGALTSSLGLLAAWIV
ncbi:hypothetical protein QEH56_22030 [Pelagicoccus enzymogenes]|uniref:diacylglycerol/polyprenol kinase family protein n=1 Tax=Pelagicoccus enzymogenes TaxID=2773457 RepID=UPI00281055E8|nr:hypothetical protein [Pelagicoccus enzymogenes]MDQ8200862.1 hypothetical protein [Pelagicoccus enzymogenes]